MDGYQTIKKSDCPHTREIILTRANQTKCEKCGFTEHLRLCTSCGAVHCCESGNAHAREHFEKTGHPIVRPLDENKDLFWCYECDAFLK